MKPLFNRVAIKRLSANLPADSLIHIPAAIRAKLDAEACRGRVVAVGAGAPLVCPECDGEANETRRCVLCGSKGEVVIPVEGIKVDDEVIFLKTSGDDEIVNGEELLFCRDWAVVARLDPKSSLPIPLQDRVFVRRRQGSRKTAFGLFIPDDSVEAPNDGEVVVTGPGLRLANGTLQACELRPGDRVMFQKWAPEIQYGAERLVLLREGAFGGGDILGVYVKESAA